MDTIASRLAHVRQLIAEAALEASRDPDQIQLVAVSKTHSAASIRLAYEAGQHDFGENYVQELVAKAEELGDLSGIRWHMIGHLQRNKVRHVVGVAAAIHSVDSVRLVHEIGRRHAELHEPFAAARRLGVFVEVNVAGEHQKSGCAPSEVEQIVEAAEQQPSLALLGLMTVPPHTEDPAAARPFFDELVHLRDRYGGPARLPELSMGMTHDLRHAVLAGATVVRIGTAIFGQRPPKLHSPTTSR